jgi:hypothetical protein
VIVESPRKVADDARCGRRLSRKGGVCATASTTSRRLAYRRDCFRQSRVAIAPAVPLDGARRVPQAVVGAGPTSAARRGIRGRRRADPLPASAHRITQRAQTSQKAVEWRMLPQGCLTPARGAAGRKGRWRSGCTRAGACGRARVVAPRRRSGVHERRYCLTDRSVTPVIGSSIAVKDLRPLMKGGASCVGTS